MNLPPVRVRYESEHAEAVSGARAVRGAVQGVQSQTTSAAGSTGRFTTALGRLGNASNTTRSRIQQASFQIQDIAVQLQGGTRASVALSQQLPQLAGAFGHVGSVIGTGIALGIPAVVFAMSQMGDESQDLESAMEDLADVADRLKEPLRILQMDGEELATNFGDAAEQIQRFALANAQLAASQAISRLNDQASIAGDLVGNYRRAIDAGRTYQNTLARIAEDFGVSTSHARDFEAALDGLVEARGLEDQSEALDRILTLTEAYGLSLADLPPEIQEAVGGMTALVTEAAAAAAEAERLNGAIINISDNMTSGTFLNPALWGDNLLPPAPGQGGSSGRGGRGTTDRFAQDLERLQDSLRTEREVLEEWYAESEAMLSDALRRRLTTEERYRDDMLRLEGEYQERMGRIRGRGEDDTLAGISQLGSDILSTYQGNSEGLIRAVEGTEAILAGINAYGAAAKTLNDPTLPWWQRVSAALGVLSAGLGFQSAISGGSAGGASSTAEAGEEAASSGPQPLSVLINQSFAPGSYSAQDVAQSNRDLFGAFASEVKRRGGSVNVLFG